MACLLTCLAGPVRAETCRFDGVTSYDGHLAVVSDTAASGGTVEVDVRLRLDAQPLPLFHTRYLMEEISTADANGVELLAVNSRYLVDGRIVRQGWDVWDRTTHGLDAHRIEGKHQAEFARQHPAFARWWDPATFGQRWLHDFQDASPERRRDLDLAAMNEAVRPPLALAFYWLRWLPVPAAVPVFLPGFKDEKRVDLAIGPAGATGGPTLGAPLRYPELSPAVASTASAWLVSHQVLQLAFDLHGRQYSARASIRSLGCTGAPVPPPA